MKNDDVKISFARDQVNENVDILFSFSAIPISRSEQLLDHFDKNNE